jgi:alcohol dehydrogenase class IV
VCKWNLAKGANVERQKIASDILWEDPTVGDIFNKIGLKKESSDLGDLLDAIIRTLGLPRTLAAVGVGQDKLSSLAANSLHDRFVKSNPYPIRNTKAVMEILKMVVG